MNFNQQSISSEINKAQPETLAVAIRDAAEGDGFDWEDYSSPAEQVIVFGSLAVGMHTPQSDIDILCVGIGQNYRSSGLQIIWMSQKHLSAHVARGSELACHIASYGVWLKGRRTLPNWISPSGETVIRRRQCIDARARALKANWTCLRQEYRWKHACRIRRDVQRLLLLKAGLPNLPAPALDTEWKGTSERERCFRDWLSDEPALFERLTADLLTVILRTECS